MDIVPEKADLVVSAKVGIGDADDLRVGQSAQVKFLGLHERNMPIIMGRVTRLSADSLVEEKTGDAYYTAEVRVPADQMQQIKNLRGKEFEFRAGAPVTVLVPLKKRTALQYFFEPLAETMWMAFREH